MWLFAHVFVGLSKQFGIESSSQAQPPLRAARVGLAHDPAAIKLCLQRTVPVLMNPSPYLML